MYRVVNVPHASNKRAVLTASVENSSAVVDPEGEAPYNSSGVCDLYIGDHMFEPDKRDHLRKMVADAIMFAIASGRDVGYRQAQSDIREALGVPLR